MNEVLSVKAGPHTMEEDFQHFLTYSGLRSQPVDVVEKLRVAFDAAWGPSSNASDVGQEPERRGHCVTCMTACAHSVGDSPHEIADHPEGSLDMVSTERAMDAVELRDIARYFDQLGKKSNGDFLRKLAEKYLTSPASGKDAKALEDEFFYRGVLSALGALAPHSTHGSTMHDEIVRAVGKDGLYSAAEPEDVQWAGLDPEYYAALAQKGGGK